MADSPVINGNRYGWSSVEWSIDGVDTPDFTDMTYSPSVDVGKVRGRGKRVLGRTAGEADCDGSFTMLKKEASALIKKLGPGFMTGKKDFSMTISYDEDGEDGIITDELIGVRITKVEDNPKQGTDPITTKFDIHIMRMKLHGVDPHGDEEG